MRSLEDNLPAGGVLGDLDQSPKDGHHNPRPQDLRLRRPIEFLTADMGLDQTRNNILGLRAPYLEGRFFASSQEQRQTVCFIAQLAHRLFQQVEAHGRCDRRGRHVRVHEIKHIFTRLPRPFAFLPERSAAFDGPTPPFGQCRMSY